MLSWRGWGIPYSDRDCFGLLLQGEAPSPTPHPSATTNFKNINNIAVIWMIYWTSKTGYVIMPNGRHSRSAMYDIYLIRKELKSK